MTARLFSLCVLAALCGESALLAAPPSVESVAPGVGQRGTEFTLKLVGARLDKPEELHLYNTGVSVVKLTAASENEVAVTLKAAADCPLGEQPFRVRTAGGVSELRVFRVTPFPVVLEAEPNDKTPQEVPLNVTVAGATEASGVDRFAVKLKKGERLSAEVEGVRLAADLTDTALTVTGPDGKPLAFADDTPLFRQDPFVSLVAPADGTYTVEVRDTNFGGSDNHRYALHLGTFVRPVAVYPAGGEAGTDMKVKLFDDSGETSQTVKLPPAGTPFTFFPSDRTGPAAPTPNPFRVSPFPNVLEAEPNDTPGNAGKAVAWPVAFNGVIEKPGDADHFRFTARKGDEVDLQAFAYRLGTPLDPVVAVLHANGDLLGWNDDDETHDSRLKVRIPADGEYLVRVTDKRKQGGPRFIYRLELTKPAVGLGVFLAPTARKTQEKQSIIIPRGNRVVAYMAVRRDGIDGPVSIAATDLPKGVTAQVPPIPVGEFVAPVVFEAAADAPVGGKLVSFTGKCGDDKQPVTGGFEQAIDLLQGPGDSILHAVNVSRLAVAVTEEAPYSVSLVAPKATVPVDGTMDITVKVTRAKDFTEALDVFFLSLPPGVEAPTKVAIPADKSEMNVTLVGHPAAERGEWKLLVETKVGVAGRGERDPLMVGNNGLGTGGPPTGGTGRRPRRKSAEGLPPVASEVTAVVVANPAVVGKLAPTAVEQGKSVNVVCEFEKPTEAAFTAKLDGLPPRATAADVPVKAGSKSVTFAVRVAADTPAADHKSLVCELSGVVSGHAVVYRVGRGGSLKVSPPGAVQVGKDGRPLSPLEALRQSEKK
jgi:hypothetical protein